MTMIIVFLLLIRFIGWIYFRKEEMSQINNDLQQRHEDEKYMYTTTSAHTVL